MARPIRMWFDFISPFAYLGWKRLHVLADTHGRSVEPVPVLFAAMLDHFGHLGPAEIAPKREFIFKQCIRRAARLQIPFSPPPSHPFRPLLGLRVASLDMPTDQRRAAIDALYDATWGGGPGIETAEQVSAILDAAGLPGAQLVERASTPTNKERLKQQTREAIESGAFGVPSYLIDNELFWGDDSYEDMDAFLRGEDPATPELLAQWAQLPSSARRPGSAR